MPRRFLSLLCTGLLALSGPARAEFLLQPHDVLALCGDSITAQRLYSVYVEEYLLLCQPAPDLRIIQFGWSGETASGFLARMENDVLPFKPTVISICYGMNDGAYKNPNAKIRNAYREGLDQALKTFRNRGVRAGVVCSAGAVDPSGLDRRMNQAIAYNETLAGLRDEAREISLQNGFAFADLHSLMLAVIQNGKTATGRDYVLCQKDGIHPIPRGHLVMAYGLLRALGCDGEIGSFTFDMKTQKASASEGHRIVGQGSDYLKIESRRYPFCFAQSGLRGPEVDSSSVLPYLAFNRDLNRFMFRVAQLEGSSAQITWGNHSKVFSKTALEKGINLAEEFPINPFCNTFFKVENAVATRQTREIGDMRNTLNPLLKEPDKKKAAQIAAATVAISQKRFETVRALIVPVTHSIRIHPLP